MKSVKLAVICSGILTLAIAGQSGRADNDLELLFDLAAQHMWRTGYPAPEAQDRPPRRRVRNHDYHGTDPGRRQYRPSHSISGNDGFGSYTSPPIRGGSSRRTRIVENPYSERLVTGITLTGIDDDIVHIKDVVSYPGRHLLSPLGYTLDYRLPPRYINTRHFIDYISVAAKRKEYFTVTFHYD